MISVVSPFYNESAILEKAVEEMLSNLEELPEAFEFILVNDGSTDDSLRIAEDLVSRYPNRLRLITYDTNHGRGYALRKGIEAARGDITVTTEADGSWEVGIVLRLVEYLKHHPEKDVVIASPHLLGGGYKNVPRKRVMLSLLGNMLIRKLFWPDITMFTGMTRAYRTEVIEFLPLESNGKEFHLEILSKLHALKARVGQIPCCLEWKEHKLTEQKSKKRESSTPLISVMMSHLLFAVCASPWRYLFGISFLLMTAMAFFFILALVSLTQGGPAIYFGMVSGLSFVGSVLLFIFGVLANQNSTMEQELWHLQRDCRKMMKKIEGHNPIQDG